MNSTTMSKVAGVIAGLAAVAIVLALPAPARAKSPTGEPRRPSSEVKMTLPQDAYLFQQPNPLGLRSLASPEQFAEAGDLYEGPSEIDAQVGAGEQDVLTTPPVVATHPRSGGGWMEQAVITVVVLAALGVTLGLVFMPGDRIPRIGARPSQSEG